MRFKEGSKVEVSSKKDTPSGSWRCAEILHFSGHTYTVRYDGKISSNDGALMEMVSEKEIRPCPPSCEIAGTWMAGDVVEIFNNFSWKMAIICKVLCEEYFLVRLSGTLLEFKVSRFDIRTRQSWQDGKWILIGKGSRSSGDVKQDQNLILKLKSQNNFQIKATRSDEHVKPTYKKLKRRLYGSGQVETTRKHRAVEKDGKQQQVVITNQSLTQAMTSRNKTTGENFMHCSFNYQSRLSDMDMERRLKPSDDLGCSSAVELYSDNESIGSCSFSARNSPKFQHQCGFVDDDDNDHYSDAGSFCQQREKERDIRVQKKQEIAAKIHMLELHAYRCTMEALYASGPLSWDKEALVTNLRLSLNISNDEHLMEVRNLVSSDNSFPSR